MSEARTSNGSPDLPEEWEWKTLGEIGDYHNGRAFKKEEWAAEGRPIIRIQNLTDPTKSFNYFDGDAEQRHVVRRGDILVSWAATLGAYRWEGDEAVLNQHIFKVVSKIDPDFHLLLVRNAISTLYARSHGSGMVHVTRAKFNEIPVAVPPADLQRTIVDAVETEQSRVDLIEEEIEELTQLQRQFIAASRAEVFASKCEPVALGEVAEVQSGITKNTSRDAGQPEVPYLSTANVQAGWLDLGNVKRVPASFERQQKHRLQRGDVLVLEGGDPDKVGRGWIWDDEIPGCLHQNHLFAVRPKADRLLPRYLAHFVNAPQARRAFLADAKQTTGIASINKTQLRALQIPLPSLKRQQEIVDLLEDAIEFARAFRAELATSGEALESLRRAISYSACTGMLISRSER
ncbi:MAG TPA: restriction endonuclease subunit S [Solirubrobacterales bacterium]